MAANKDGTFGKPVVNARILQLQMDYEFPKESLEAKMKRVMLLMEEESELKKVIKAQKIELEAATIETIKNLDEEDALRLLELKWIEPIVSGLGTLPDDVITALVSEVENLNSKYVTTYSDIEVKKESAAVMQSDIMLQSGEKVLIIDAKYYEHSTQVQFDKHTLHSGNLYQIFTYVKNKEYELREKDHTVSGMLLYAKTDEEIYPNNVYQMSGNQITVRTLNLNLPFDEIAGQLNTIAKTHFDL